VNVEHLSVYPRLTVVIGTNATDIAGIVVEILGAVMGIGMEERAILQAKDAALGITAIGVGGGKMKDFFSN
jgi:hypothetical protein